MAAAVRLHDLVPEPVMRPIDKILAALVFVIVLFSIGIFTDLVGITYPVEENVTALKDPVKVIHIGNNRMTLADGRVVDMAWAFGGNWPEMVADGKLRVEMQGPKDGSKVWVYVDKPGHLDHSPWDQPIRIPILPQKINNNMRTLIGVGKVLR